MAAKKKAKTDTKAPKLEAAPVVVPGVKIAKQSYEIRSVVELKHHPKNPRRGNLDAIGESMERNDFYGAALVQKSTNLVLVGNHRLKEAIAKGLKEIPVIVIDCDDATAERIMLADNRISDLASYDDRALLMLLEDRAKAGDMSGTGFADADLVKMQAKANPPMSFPEYEGQVEVSYTCPSCAYSWK